MWLVLSQLNYNKKNNKRTNRQTSYKKNINTFPNYKNKKLRFIKKRLILNSSFRFSAAEIKKIYLAPLSRLYCFCFRCRKNSLNMFCNLNTPNGRIFWRITTNSKSLISKAINTIKPNCCCRQETNSTSEIKILSIWLKKRISSPLKKILKNIWYSSCYPNFYNLPLNNK